MMRSNPVHSKPELLRNITIFVSIFRIAPGFAIDPAHRAS